MKSFELISPLFAVVLFASIFFIVAGFSVDSARPRSFGGNTNYDDLGDPDEQRGWLSVLIDAVGELLLAVMWVWFAFSEFSEKPVNWLMIGLYVLGAFMMLWAALKSLKLLRDVRATVDIQQ